MDWDEEREGYINSPRPAYPPIHAPADQLAGRHHLRSIHREEILAGLITVAGAAWGVYGTVVEHVSFWQLQLSPPGPAEICGLGILIWLHAKWRHANAG